MCPFKHFNLSVIIEFPAANKSVVIWLKTCQFHLGATGLVVGHYKFSTESHLTYLDHCRDKVKWTGLWTSYPIKVKELPGLDRKLAQKSDLVSQGHSVTRKTQLLKNIENDKTKWENRGKTFRLTVQVH